MSIMDALKVLMVHSMTIEPWAGQDRYSQPIYGPAVTYAARIQAGMGRNAPKDELVSMLTIWVSEPVEVDPRDRVTIPATFGTRDANGVFAAPRVVLMSVEPINDMTGQIGTVLRCGRG